MKYIWNDNWINPYESAWNIGEKIFAANVSANIYNQMMGVSVTGISINYSKDGLLYSRGPFNSSFVPYFMQDGVDFFDIFSSESYYLSKKIRYCPECAKYGYHSIFHQLIYMDKCIIHNRKLHYLCTCNNSGIIEWKTNRHNSPFSCRMCCKVLPYPEVAEGIVNKWSNAKRLNKVKPSSEIKHIYTVDLIYMMDNHDIDRRRLTDKQLNLLLNITKGVKIDSLPKPILISDINMADEHLLFLAEKIQDYLVTNYGVSYCKKQFCLLGRYMSKESYSNFDFDIIAAFYLMGELLCKNHLDRIYPVNFLGIPDWFDSSYNELLDCIDKCFLRKINMEIPRYTAANSFERKNYRTYAIVNYMYKIYATIRYKEIKEHLINSSEDNYPVNPNNITIKAENKYPIFIILEMCNGKLLLY